MPTKKFNEIRVVLDNFNKGYCNPIFWGCTEGGDLRLNANLAFDLMRQGILVTFALADPQDKTAHFETQPVNFMHI